MEKNGTEPVPDIDSSPLGFVHLQGTNQPDPFSYQWRETAVCKFGFSHCVVGEACLTKVIFVSTDYKVN